jgi:hypothetical protein
MARNVASVHNVNHVKIQARARNMNEGRINCDTSTRCGWRYYLYSLGNTVVLLVFSLVPHNVTFLIPNTFQCYCHAIWKKVVCLLPLEQLINCNVAAVTRHSQYNDVARQFYQFHFLHVLLSINEFRNRIKCCMCLYICDRASCFRY